MKLKKCSMMRIKHPYLTLNGLDKYKELPPTLTILKYKVGDRVRILVNYLSEIELNDNIDIVWETTITEIHLDDPSLSYYLGEVRCFFQEDELELI